MKRFTNVNIVKERKSIKIIFIISLFFLVSSVCFFYWAYKIDIKNDIEYVDLEHLINKNDSKKHYVFLNAYPKFYQFAKYNGIDKSFYIVYNEDNFYVAYMKNSEAKKLKSNSDKKINLFGVSKIPTNDIKKLAVDYYNKYYDNKERKITLEEYDVIFGNVYIDTTDYISNSIIQTILGIVSLVVFAIIFIYSIIKKIKYSKSLKNISDSTIYKIDKEMNDKDAFYYKRTKLYLTDNYIVNFSGKFSINEYKDIYWLYPYEFRYNGVKTNQAIKFMTKEGKTYTVASLDPYSKKSKEIYNEIWDTIVSKNDSMLLGYTKENIKKSKELKKNNKKK